MRRQPCPARQPRTSTPPIRQPQPAASLVAVLAAGLASLLTTGVACSRSPIQGDAPRSPYDRYEVLRGTSPAKTVTDSFGKEQPNLRGRLERDGY